MELPYERKLMLRTSAVVPNTVYNVLTNPLVTLGSNPKAPAWESMLRMQCQAAPDVFT